jgi:RimJ/RimL family protein N-acetyltransferase
MNELIFVDLKSLSEQNVRTIAKIDNSIPAEYDANWKPSENDHENRLKYYQGFSDLDFFKVVFNKEEIVAFYFIKAVNMANCNIGMIVTLWVLPSYRNKGIAKRLKELGVQWAINRNIDYLQTTVHSNNRRMMDINLKAGFKDYSNTLRMKISSRS